LIFPSFSFLPGSFHLCLCSIPPLVGFRQSSPPLLFPPKGETFSPVFDSLLGACFFYFHLLCLALALFFPPPRTTLPPLPVPFSPLCLAFLRPGLFVRPSFPFSVCKAFSYPSPPPPPLPDFLRLTDFKTLPPFFHLTTWFFEHLPHRSGHLGRLLFPFQPQLFEATINRP